MTNAGDLQNVTVNIGSASHGFTVVEPEARAAMRRGARGWVFRRDWFKKVVAARAELSPRGWGVCASRAPPAARRPARGASARVWIILRANGRSVRLRHHTQVCSPPMSW